MEGWMFQTTVEDARDFLARRPPTEEQADSLAAEELLGWDRLEIFRLLDQHRGHS